MKSNYAPSLNAACSAGAAIPQVITAMEDVGQRCASHAQDVANISSRLSGLLYRLRSENLGDDANSNEKQVGIGGHLGAIYNALDLQGAHINECYALLDRLEDLA